MINDTSFIFPANIVGAMGSSTTDNSTADGRDAQKERGEAASHATTAVVELSGERKTTVEKKGEEKAPIVKEGNCQRVEITSVYIITT